MEKDKKMAFVRLMVIQENRGLTKLRLGCEVTYEYEGTLYKTEITKREVVPINISKLGFAKNHIDRDNKFFCLPYYETIVGSPDLIDAIRYKEFNNIYDNRGIIPIKEIIGSPMTLEHVIITMKKKAFKKDKNFKAHYETLIHNWEERKLLKHLSEFVIGLLFDIFSEYNKQG